MSSISLTLALRGRLLSSGTDATIKSLFAMSEPGVWYDPSDLTTLFQDNTGRTPVTSSGQTVGLMLDKSQNLALGPELVTNGDFSQGSTGWTLGNVAITNGVAVATSATMLLTQTISGLVSGRSYLVKFSYTMSSGIRLRIEGSGSLGASNALSSSGIVSLYIVANSTNFTIAAEGAVFTGTVDNISVKLLAGNHATQNNFTQRPTYRIDSRGKPYLLFDGVDDGMLTGTINPNINKVQVFAGVQKLSDAAIGVVAEFSANIALNAGCFSLTAPNNASANYNFSSKGTIQTDNIVSTDSAPITSVISGLGNIPNATNSLRVNGSQVGSTLTTQGTGNYLTYPLYIGRRGGLSAPFNGRLYSLIVRFGDDLTEGQIAYTESWINGKTGADGWTS